MHLEFTKYILELNPKKYLMTGTCWEYGNTMGIAVESSYINNELLEMGLQVGDRISFSPDSEYEFRINEEKLYRMFTENITIHWKR